MLAEARTCFGEAAAMYAAIGKRQGVAGVLVNSGLHGVRTGMLDDAERWLRASLDEFRALKDMRGQAASAINLSYVRLFRGDAAEAKLLSSEAVAFSRAANHAMYEAAALGNLGAAERDLGEFDAAINHMKEGLAIRRRLNRPGDYDDDIAHLIAAYLAAGDIEAARPLSEELAPSLATSSPAIFLPQFAHWTAARAFRELGDERRMRLMLQRGHEIVQEQAGAIEGAAEKASYLGLLVNRDIEAAFADDVWPDANGAAREARSSPRPKRKRASDRL
jgi:tetratricopeptide (TPR) repeat protein